MIELRSVTKRFAGGGPPAVNDISLQVQEGELLSLLGPSGCGKTTTLRMLAGFEQASEGSILIDGRDVTRLPPEKRGLSMVFQNYALFPHLNVFDNVAFGLRLRRWGAAQIEPAVLAALVRVGLSGLGQRMPAQLSGGQQQRVSLARALVVEPSVLLLDEPLSNLDLKLREQLRDEIRSIQRDTGLTAVYVTHDQGEAMAMSDRVAVMRAGRIEQIGSPRDIYERPETVFVARFIGQCNLLPGRYDASAGVFHSQAGLAFGVARRMDPNRDPESWTLAIRPEALTFAGSRPADGVQHLTGCVIDVVYLGDHAQLTVAVRGANTHESGFDNLTARWSIVRGQAVPAVGDTVGVGLAAEDCMLVARTEP